MKNEKLKTAILEIMEEWRCEHWSIGDRWYGYSGLQDELIDKKFFDDKDVLLKDLKKAMKELRDAGKVELMNTVTEEGLLCGSGWFLT